MREAADVHGLATVSEVMEISQIEPMLPYVDCFQVGARNMQNFNLLRELGQVRKPVLLKRGIAATIEELLLSSEYILSGGNYDVILCERGIRTYETATRNTMDISAIPVVKKLSHLPIVGDPSHGTGRRDMVAPMAKAAVAAGADALLIEIHPNADKSVGDAGADHVPRGLREADGGIARDCRRCGQNAVGKNAASTKVRRSISRHHCLLETSAEESFVSGRKFTRAAKLAKQCELQPLRQDQGCLTLSPPCNNSSPRHEFVYTLLISAWHNFFISPLKETADGRHSGKGACPLHSRGHCRHHRRLLAVHFLAITLPLRPEHGIYCPLLAESLASGDTGPSCINSR